MHGFTQDDVEKMARQLEEAPSLYLQLDVKVCCNNGLSFVLGYLLEVQSKEAVIGRNVSWTLVELYYSGHF